MAGMIERFRQWSPIEGQAAVNQAPQTFFERAKNFGFGLKHNVEEGVATASHNLKDAASSLQNAASNLPSSLQNAASNLRAGAAQTGEKLKDAVQDIQMKPYSVPKWAAALGLSFWYAPGIAATLFNCAIITGVTQFIGWAIHSGFDIASHFDLMGVLNIGFICAYSYFIQPISNLRQIIMTACAAVWSARLAGFLGSRLKDEGPDRAVVKVRNAKGRAALWAMQAVWVFTTALPVMLVNAESSQRPAWGINRFSVFSLGLLDIIGFSIWAFGFAWEFIADWEKAQFRKKQLNEGDKPFIDTGLWKLSRHPNYFGEILMWTGLYVAACSVLRGWEHIAVFSPLLTAFLLRFVTGVPRVEAQANRAFAKNASYQEYKARTPLIVPFL